MATSNKRLSPCRKLALIIGNGNYSHSYNRLKQSVNNVNDLSNLLHTIGFHVTTKSNLSKREMITAISDFTDVIIRGLRKLVERKMRERKVAADN